MVPYSHSRRRRYVMLLLVLTAITLITLDQRGAGDSGVLGAVRRGAHDVVAPVGSAAHDVVAPVSRWFDGITSAGSLQRENDRLRRQLAQARGRERQASDALHENRALKAILHLPFLGDTPRVTAQVVAPAPGNYERSIVIDKGTGDGVAVGMSVVAADGLVGRVVDASHDQSTVLLLTDPSFSVSVRMSRSRVTGIANGRAGSSTLSLEFVDANADLKVGDLAVTSGVDASRFPKGIPVGTVSEVDTSPGQLAPSAVLKPFVDPGHLEYVQVVEPIPAGATASTSTASTTPTASTTSATAATTTAAGG